MGGIKGISREIIMRQDLRVLERARPLFRDVAFRGDTGYFEDGTGTWNCISLRSGSMARILDWNINML